MLFLLTLPGRSLWGNIFEMQYVEVFDYLEDIPMFKLTFLNATSCATRMNYSRANAVVCELRKQLGVTHMSMK